jgi:hypothetical protein
MAHTAPAAPFVLHRTSIGKGAMKTFRINCQWRSELFYRLLSFFNGKSRDECSAPLERVCYPALSFCPRTVCPTNVSDVSSIGQSIPLLMRPVDDAFLVRCIPWRVHPLVKHKLYVYFQRLTAAYIFLCHHTKLCKCT